MPNKRTAVIIQPMFFPWRGQFALYQRADVVVILDTVQWVRRHWYNRNLVMGSNGAQWITVPVMVEHNRQLIKDTAINNTDQQWRRKILATLRAGYGRAPFFDRYFPVIETLVSQPWNMIAPLAQASLEFSLASLGNEVPLVRASDLVADAQDPVSRLIALCHAVGADAYLSGPAAREYIGDGAAFAQAGIHLNWMTYALPDYPQQRPYTERPLSILDLLFNVGPEAPTYVRQPTEHPAT